jgi:hypothetical protein
MRLISGNDSNLRYFTALYELLEVILMLKAKYVPLHAMEVLREKGEIASTHSFRRHYMW